MQTTRFARLMDSYCDAVEKFGPAVLLVVGIVSYVAVGAIPFLLAAGY